MKKSIRVIVAVASALVGRRLRDMLTQAPEIQVVGGVRNGKDALELIRQANPDVVALDIDLPAINGLSALQAIRNEFACPVVLVNSLVQNGAFTKPDNKALGADDFTPKLSQENPRELTSLSALLIDRIKEAATNYKRRIRTGDLPQLSNRQNRSLAAVNERVPASKIVALGVSTGAP